MKAHFDHVVALYSLELGKPVKIAYKLTEKVLNPSCIEKTNVQLADSFFHETTIAGLKFYAAQDTQIDTRGWHETANFMELIGTQWNICNVKTPLLGQKMSHINLLSLLLVRIWFS